MLRIDVLRNKIEAGTNRIDLGIMPSSGDANRIARTALSTVIHWTRGQHCDAAERGG